MHPVHIVVKCVSNCMTSVLSCCTGMDLADNLSHRDNNFCNLPNEMFTLGMVIDFRDRELLVQIRRTTLSSVICANTGITTIQPDAFLSNETRVSCANGIPKINLSAWKEKQTCFFRVNAPSSVVVFLGVRNNRPAVYTSTAAYPAHRQCIPFDCSLRNTKLLAFPRDAFTIPGCSPFRATIGPGNVLSDGTRDARIMPE